MRIKKRSTLAMFFLLALATSMLSVITPDERYLAAPVLACVVIIIWFWTTLWDRDQKIPFFDVGLFCAMAICIYTVYPLVNYWIDGMQFGFLSDNRLRSYNISPAELGYFHLRNVLYLYSFMLFYMLFRGKGTIEIGNVREPRRSSRQVIFIFFIIFTGYFYFLQRMTGVNYTTSYESEAYANNLAAFSSLPLILVQISGKLRGILFVFKLALLFVVISHCRQKQWFVILLVWIAAEIIHAFFLKGARTELIMFIMAAALLYHRLIKPLTIKFLIISGTSLFIMFIFMGIYRVYIDYFSLQKDLFQAGGGIITGGNEFQTLLGTAFDVLQRKRGGAYLPWYLYINDFITILPPQQLMPFKKVTASEWYLREIGISGTGQGLMWGVITQSIVGLDWIELVLRGGILGYILARLHRWYVRRQFGFMETLLYVFICIKVYYTFRDTTFSLLANLVWEIVPFYILFRLGVSLLRQLRGTTPAMMISPLD